MYHWCRSVADSCPTLCHPMDCRMPGFLVLDNYQSFLKYMSIELVMYVSLNWFKCFLILEKGIKQ